MSKVYCLNWDYSHSSDNERDAYHIKFPNSDKASAIFLNPRYQDKLPNQVVFKANISTIAKIDYPLTDLGIPVLSDRMLEILRKSGDFKAIITPVIIVEDSCDEDVFESNGNLKENLPNCSNYKAITLLEREDCFDPVNSIYEPSELNPEIPGYIKKLVLLNNKQFPPIFRIKEAPSRLLITSVAKEELEKYGVSGCVFEEVETSC